MKNKSCYQVYKCSKCGGLKMSHSVPKWSTYDETNPNCRHKWVKPNVK